MESNEHLLCERVIFTLIFQLAYQSIKWGNEKYNGSSVAIKSLSLLFQYSANRNHLDKLIPKEKV